MKRFEPLLGHEGQGNAASSDSTAEDQLSDGGLESGSKSQSLREKERIINLIENTRLRRGDLRGKGIGDTYCPPYFL
jgi:hypothetical protein